MLLLLDKGRIGPAQSSHSLQPAAGARARRPVWGGGRPARFAARGDFMVSSAAGPHAWPGAGSIDRLGRIIQTQSAIVQAELDLDGFMALVADAMRELTAADGAAVALVEGTQLVYRSACGSGRGLLGVRVGIDASLSGHSLREARMQCCDDARLEPRVDQALCDSIGARAVVCMPLLRGTDPVGVLSLFANAPARFGDDELQMLSLMAGTLAAALGRQIASDASARTEASSIPTTPPPWMAVCRPTARATASSSSRTKGGRTAPAASW